MQQFDTGNEDLNQTFACQFNPHTNVTSQIFHWPRENLHFCSLHSYLFRQRDTRAQIGN